MLNARITKTGLRYNLIYICVCILPFFFFLGKEGMTAIIAKTLGYITLPIPLIIWLFDLDTFHRLFSIHISINIVLNVLFLLWLGSFVERRN